MLPQILREHERNAGEIDYLYNYYKGKQPILNKTKVVRSEINHRVLENHAFEIVEFKKSYVYGEPVQYVQKGEKENDKKNPAISDLNRFMESEDKSSLDKEIAEWQYICGTAYRWVDTDNSDDVDDAPFEMRVPDPRQTFVVYSSGIRGEQLFSGHYSYVSDAVMTEQETSFAVKHRVITIYTDTDVYKIEENAGTYVLLEQVIPVGDKEVTVNSYPLIAKGHRIIEYPLNNARLGLIELVMSGLNAINQVKSNDLDAIDQFVQSLLVFINQDVNAEEIKELLKLGAVKINSTSPDKPADLKLLESQIKHSETKIVVDELYNSILSIVGIPRLNQKASGGDTGQARLLGEGWTMADERAKQDELAFKKSERKVLKTVLSICKNDDQLKDLKISDIDIKFTRNKSDNLLVKTQGLLNMKQSQVPPDVAFTICGLFSDPNDVYQKSVEYYGKEFWVADETITVSNNYKENQNANDINKSTSTGEGKKPVSQNNSRELVKNDSEE